MGTTRKKQSSPFTGRITQGLIGLLHSRYTLSSSTFFSTFNKNLGLKAMLTHDLGRDLILYLAHHALGLDGHVFSAYLKEHAVVPVPRHQLSPVHALHEGFLFH